MLKNRSDAEDVMQDTFIKVFQNSNLYSEQGSPKAWLYRIAKNTLIDFQRKNLRKPQIVELKEEHIRHEGDVSSVIEEKEMAHIFEKAINDLPPAQREVYFLRQRSGLSFIEISELLNEPKSRVLGRMHLALKKLKSILGGMS